MAKIKNEKSSEFMKNLDGYDYVFENTEDEKEFSEDQTLDFAERFANHRIIEEFYERLGDKIYISKDGIRNLLTELEQELKQ